MSTSLHTIRDLIPEDRLHHFVEQASENTGAALAFLDPEGKPLSTGARGEISSDALTAHRKPIESALRRTSSEEWVPDSDGFVWTSSVRFRESLVGFIVLEFPREREGKQKEKGESVRRERLAHLVRNHFTDLLVAGFELNNLSSEIVRNYEEMALLYDLSIKLSAQTDLDRICQIVAKEVRTVIPSKNISIFLVDPVTGDMDSRAALPEGDSPPPPIKIPAGEGTIGRVAQSGQPIILCDVAQDPEFKTFGYPVHSLMCVPMTLGRKTLGLINVSDKPNGAEFTTYEQKLIMAIAAEAAVALENTRLITEVKDLFLSAVRSLVMAIDAKDPYTHLHSVRVSEVSAILAEELGMSAADVEQIKLAALLHDVGKIGVPEQVLLKPEKLNHDEWQEMKQHPLHSVHILGQVKQFATIVKWVRHEHEHYDGTGYPDRLSRDDIPLPSRIIAVADAFDAITSDRYYRKGRSEEVAVKILKESSGIQFDPEVTQAFLNAVQKGRFKGLPS